MPGQKKFPTPKSAKRITDDRDRALFVISVAAELTGVHPQTLREYERRGLLQPQRTEGRARRYSQRDIEHVRLIQDLTQREGMNLAGVQKVMEMTRRIEQMEQEMQRLRDEAERARRRLSEERATVSLVPMKNLPTRLMEN